MRTVIAAVHGIGFARPGDLEPALARLTVADDQVRIDANWNEIAGKDYRDHVNFGQLRKLGRAIDGTASLRPCERTPPRGRNWEIAVDLADLFFTLPLWGLGPVCTLALLSLVEKIHSIPEPPRILAFVGYYLAANFLLVGASVAALGAAIIGRARPVAVARLTHLVLAGIRPWLILSYAYLVMTRWRGQAELTLSITLALLSLGAVWLVLGYFGWAEGVGLAVILVLVVLYGIGPFVVARLLAPGLKLMLDVLLYLSDPDYRDSIQESLGSTILAGKGEAAEAKLVLIGHSLGSVIAADAIARGDLSGHFGSIVLVTAGSPIRRFFQRFFPGHLVPESAEALVAGARSDSDFRWLNYYRRFDIVGGKLGLPPDGSCRECLSPMIADPLSSHVDYWSEEGFLHFIAANAKEAKACAG